MQDTPGTDLEADIGAIVAHVQAQNAAYLALESDPGRTQPMSALPDPRFDVVRRPNSCSWPLQDMAVAPLVM